MFFLNLSLPEFLALFTAVSGVVVALYLLDRSRRKQVVPTLRFWTGTQRTESTQRRRKIQQPWSLLLQLISLCLLLLAIAQLRWGTPDERSRDHVVLLDTSAWMAGRVGQETLLDEGRSAVRAYLKALPGNDRVMLIRTDALATPATGFEVDRAKLDQALQQSVAGSTALNFDQGVQFAQQIQRRHGRQSGEIVYVGPARVMAQHGGTAAPLPPQFRFLPLKKTVENWGLRKVGLRRSPTDAELWDVYVAARNYGDQPRRVTVSLQFGGRQAGMRQVLLTPGVDQDVTFPLRTRAAGPLEVRILENDGIAEDNRAVLAVPAQKLLRIAVYSPEPDQLRPIFAANQQVKAEFFAPSAYRSDVDADVVVLDRFAPADAATRNAIFIAPPANRSPIPVRTTLANAPLTRWHSDNALGEGLRTKKLDLENASILSASPNDISVAEVEGGPVVVARPGKPKVVVIGFQPAATAMRYELATPLLFANVLRWMEPDTFRRWELTANTVGGVSVPLEREADPDTVKISTGDGRPLPYTFQGKTVRFFVSQPGVVRVQAGDREWVYSLSLPEVADTAFPIPADVTRGVPRSIGSEVASRDLWQMLAVLGMLGLLLEWVLFGRKTGVLNFAQATAEMPVLGSLLRRIRPARRVAGRPLRKAS